MSNNNRRDFLKNSILVFPSILALKEANLSKEKDSLIAMPSRYINRNNLLIFGTASDAGENVITSGLIRLFKRKDIPVFPFKPISIADEAQDYDHYRFTEIYSIAAGISFEYIFNPVHLSYDYNHSRVNALYIHGKRHDYDNRTLTDYKVIKEHIDKSLDRMVSQGKRLIVEGISGLSDWANLEEFNFFLNQLNPQIILVSDITKGGGLASVIGTLEMLPLKIKNRIGGVVFNNINLDSNLYSNWNDYLISKYQVEIVGYVPPNLKGIDIIRKNSLSNNYSLELVNQELDMLARVIENCWNRDFLRKLLI